MFRIWLAVCLVKLGMSFNQSSIWQIESPLENSYIIPIANSTFRSNRSVLETANFLRNKTIVFVGDSVTRYQFLYLLRYLDSGQWTDAWGHQLFFERYYKTWADFFAAVSAVFGCHILCDATRTGEHPHGQENQYYHHGELNLTLSFHFWSINVMRTSMPYPSRDDFAYSCQHFTSGHPATVIYPHSHNMSVGSWDTSSYEGVEQFLNSFIAPLQPDMLIINHGIWERYGGNDPMKLDPVALKSFIIASLSAAKMTVWKVTTAQRGGSSEPHESEELLEQMHNQGMKIFHTYNLTWEMAREIPSMRLAMWDPNHYMPFVYRELNIALLERMQAWFGNGNKDHNQPHHQHHQNSHSRRRTRSRR